MEVQFNYAIGKNAKGVIRLNRFQYEGICILNQDLVLNGYEPIILEESIPIALDKEDLKSMLHYQVNRIIQKTISQYPDYSEELVKEIIKDKFYHKFNHPAFLYADLVHTKYITKAEIESYKKKLDALKYLLNELI